MIITYNKHSRDLEPFVQDMIKRFQYSETKHIVSLAIKGYNSSTGAQHGAITKTTLKGRKVSYTITLNRKGKHKSYEPLECTLTTLAHELAHLTYWNHGRAHFQRMAILLMYAGCSIEEHQIDYTKEPKLCVK